MPQPPPNNRNQALMNVAYVHPEVEYWRTEWEKIRDSVIGETEIKRKATAYLPKLEGMDKKDYAAFLQRAVFFNMSSRTVTGLVGKLFRRAPKTEGVPQRLEDRLKTITKDGQSLNMLARSTASEVFTIGRYGVLLDMDESGIKPPYLTGYLAENIIDWQTGTFEGREVLTEVVLREIRLEDRSPAAGAPMIASGRRYFASYRVLRLEAASGNPTDLTGPRVYRQYVFTANGADASISAVPTEVHTPTIRGREFDFIPFVFFGPESNLTSVQKSPILDIVSLNMSHYRSYAHLEHGRFFTAMPIYYVPEKAGVSNAEYRIGPSTVWVVDENQKPGILEFNGQGLTFLENALSGKEAQAAALGGRLMGMTSQSTAESDNTVKLKEANEQALLLNAAEVLSSGFTQLLQWWAMWQDVQPAQVLLIEFNVSKDFIFDQMAAREFRAIHAMYVDGVLPVEVVYDYLRRAEVVPDWMSVEEFTGLLEDGASFPNQIDIQARLNGLPSGSTEHDDIEAEKDRQLERDLKNLQGRQQQDAIKTQGKEAMKQQRAAVRAQRAAAKNTPTGGNNA